MYVVKIVLQKYDFEDYFYKENLPLYYHTVLMEALEDILMESASPSLWLICLSNSIAPALAFSFSAIW